MKTNQAQKNIPSDWQQVKLGHIVNYVKGFAFKSQDYTNNGIRVIRVSDLGRNTIHNDNMIFINKDEVNNYSKWKLKENDLIFTTVGSKPPQYDSLVGRVIRVDKKNENSLLNQNAVLIRTKKQSEVNQAYIFNHFLTQRYIYFIESIIRGNANQGSITLEDLFEFSFKIPNIFEQNRIVSVLETWDKSIGNLNKKIEIKKQIKKGLMQDLLTGKKRLNGFKDKWHYIKIKNLTNLVQGSKSNGGDVGYLEIGDVDIDSKSYEITKKDKLTVKGAVMVPKGTLLISTVRPTRGAITITKENLFVSSAFCKLSIKNLFVYYIVNFKTFFNYLGDNSGGGTYPTCKNEDIIEYEFFAPTSIEEQNAIADILTTADKEITELENKLSIIKDQKKFLLNNLITGAIRTPENLSVKS